MANASLLSPFHLISLFATFLLVFLSFSFWAPFATDLIFTRFMAAECRFDLLMNLYSFIARFEVVDCRCYMALPQLQCGFLLYIGCLRFLRLIAFTLAIGNWKTIITFIIDINIVIFCKVFLSNLLWHPTLIDNEQKIQVFPQFF